MPEEKKEGLRRFKKIVLDLGCRNANELAMRAERHPEFFYVGIEVGGHALERAMKKYSHLPNIAFIRGDASMMSIKDGKISEATAKSLFSALAKGRVRDTEQGRIIIIEPASEDMYKKVADEVHRVLGSGKRFRVHETDEEGAVKGIEALAKSKLALVKHQEFNPEPPYFGPTVVEKYKKLKPKQKKRRR